MSKLPAPLVPAEVDLRSLEYMPLYIATLKNSKAWLLTKRKPALMRPLLCLWISAWQSVPAGSLEDDDDVLANAADLSFDDFQEWRDDLLRGWKRCADGRLYLPSMVPMVMRAHELLQRLRAAGRAGSRKRWGNKGDSSSHTNSHSDSSSREGGKEGGKEVKEGPHAAGKNGHTSRDAMLMAMTAIRDNALPDDPIAVAIIDDLGGLAALHAKNGAALADAMRDFENRYKTRQREGRQP